MKMSKDKKSTNKKKDKTDPIFGNWKIFPRNLTAKSDYIVKGNSSGTRPESGVDNCYPGLEFDQRNLDKSLAFS